MYTIKVKKATNPNSWYANQIGEVFSAIDYTHSMFTVKLNGQDLIILKDDVEILDTRTAKE